MRFSVYEEACHLQEIIYYHESKLNLHKHKEMPRGIMGEKMQYAQIYLQGLSNIFANTSKHILICTNMFSSLKKKNVAHWQFCASIQNSLIAPHRPTVAKDR